MKESHTPNSNFTFTKKNYVLLSIGMILIIAGIFFMRGGEMEEESMFDFKRTILSPILIILGYIINVFAILYSPKEK